MKPVEFSNFYKILNSVKEGNSENKLKLEELIRDYQESKDSESALHQLGQIFINVGIKELYEYTGINDIQKNI